MGLFYCIKNILNNVYIYIMKKTIDINEEDLKFMNDYKQSHGVVPTKFIDMAIREKIVKTKLELKLKENAVN